MINNAIDWSILLLKIRSKTGRDMARIARDVNSHYQHIAKLSRGEVAEPTWSMGLKLLDYYHENVGGDMSEILK